MSEALDKLNAGAAALAHDVDKRIEHVAGRRMKYTLIVWDDELWKSGTTESVPDPERYGLTCTHLSSLPGVLLPVCLRQLADRVEANKTGAKH